MHLTPQCAHALAALCLLFSLNVLALPAAAQSFPSSCWPAPGATLECSGLKWEPYRCVAISCNGTIAFFGDAGSAASYVFQVDGWNNLAGYCSRTSSLIGWKSDPTQGGVAMDCGYGDGSGLPGYYAGVERGTLLLYQHVDIFSPPQCTTTNSFILAPVSRDRQPDCPNANNPYQNWYFNFTYCYRGAQPDPNKNNGDCPNCPRGNPVNPATGNKYERQLDYAGSGPYPLRFERFYNSLMRGPNDLGSVYFPVSYFQSFGELGLVQLGLNRNGVNWRHYYERSIQYTPVTNAATDPGISSAFALRQDGKVLTFTKYNGQFVAEADRVADQALPGRVGQVFSFYCLTRRSSVASTVPH